MAESFTLFLATVELIFFFTFDFVLARVLNALKQDHPELEECAPEDAPDLDPVAVVDSLRHTVVEIYDYQHQRLTGNAVGAMADAVPGEDFASSPPPPSYSRGNVLYSAVVVCGLAAPAITFLQFVFPTALGWCRFELPAWLQYIFVIPGLAAVFLFAARTTHVARYTEVTRQQWVLLMWFRLDFMCLMSAVALFGAGGWLVALCMFAVALYLAHRVMRIEKRLAHLTRETQLVRGEVDIEHVYRPGSEEAERALAASDVKGYSALR
ncbi:uncharacterized protein Tco025E_00400 [Trypanosoma conorhini]|uniref:Uncharacterized protein n=1 Tax=Trypanosoma conorhini TaxID=83891 RepID=A0A3R7PYZ5_9TRYP|nr:uncharacterized protein Tco025E_00400 [Trypanosoma conorhini]RNF27330.1 hypothetical protein Tco025E_00400 [Trypanosoma conorhini]